MELLSLIKRKSRNSSSDSSSNSPEFKRRREEDAEAEQSDIVLTALHMAQNFASKADEILAKLTQLDAITLQIKLLQNSVDKINATVSALENEVALIKNDLKTASSEMNELKNSVSSLNKDVAEGKSSLEALRKKTEEDHRKLELQLLNYEVYQRRENLRFYGIREEGTDENTKETLYNFFETELGIEDARRIEFQRVHRVGKEKRNPSVSSLNKDVEEGKSSLEAFRKKTEEDHRKLELQLLNYEVYQRREILWNPGGRHGREH